MFTVLAYCTATSKRINCEKTAMAFKV